MIRQCENCGAQYRRTGRVALTSRACSRKCLGALQSRDRKGRFGVGMANPMWRGGIQIYRRYRKVACELCGSGKYLVVHHLDENRYHNDEANLQTLCKACHQAHHATRDAATGRYV